MRDLRALILPAVLACASCGPATVNDQIGFTKFACLSKASDLFPDVKKAADDLDVSNRADVDNESANAALFPGETFRFVTTGKFIYGIPSGAVAGISPLTCTGDFNRKMIETINHGGLDKRPAQGEVWSI